MAYSIYVHIETMSLSCTVSKIFFDKLKAKFATADDLHLHDIVGDTTIEKDRSYMTTLRHQLSMNYQNNRDLNFNILDLSI